MEEMRTYTFFEHQTRSLRELQLASDDRILSDLERLNRSHGADLMRVERHGLTARHYVGVLRLGDVTFQILPKIDFDGDSDALAGTPQQHRAAASAMQNLLYLLSYTDELTLHHQAVTALGAQPMDWFELLIRLFADNLHTQIKRGVERAYVYREERLTTLRGTWQIDRQIVRPPFERHLFDVAYDEFESDTPLNRVLRFVVSRLLELTRDSRNQALLRDIDIWLSDVRLMPSVDRELLDRVHFSRLNVRFRPAFNMARMFLERLGPQLVSHRHELFAFVFDMQLLFEQFVAAFLRRHRSEVFQPLHEDLQIVAQSVGWPVWLAKQWPGGRAVFRLQPDILLTTGHNVRAIIDTKYKRLDSDSVPYGVAEADLYQMLAYAIAFGCNRLLLLYPGTAQSSAIHAEFSIVDQATTIHIQTLDLRQPLSRPKPLIDALRPIMQRVLREGTQHGS